jgi:adenine-specific DNA methylase
MTIDDIKAEGFARRWDIRPVAKVVEGPRDRKYLPIDSCDAKVVLPVNNYVTGQDARSIETLYERMPGKGRHRAVASQLPYYGFQVWNDVFIPRQRLALSTLTKLIVQAKSGLQSHEYPPDWVEAICAYLSAALDRVADRGSNLCHWDVSRSSMSGTFQGFKLQMTWDFAESNPIGDSTGGWDGQVAWVAQVAEKLCAALKSAKTPVISVEPFQCSKGSGPFDVIVTDPPYYDAIPYADLSDFFYVWLKRSLGRVLDTEFQELTPKTEELIQHTKSGEEGRRGREFYQQGMEQCFQRCYEALAAEGRLAIVFANKDPEAWETLVASLIRSGFAVDASWPIETEMTNRVVALAGAGLSSSIWLVCRKRPERARPGWDTQVLEEMRENIYKKLRQFWDAGIRGPDFVWAATGPALEAFSKHPVVKKADEPNSLMTVSEFLRHIRRIVVDYVVGRILSQNGYSEDASALDDVTLYYLLRRHDFSLNEAPVGASILYAQSCNLRDRDLADRHDLLSYGKSRAAAEAEEEDEGGEGGEAEEEEVATSGSTVKLKRWDQRRRKELGMNVGARPAPLVDQVHHIMQLWRAGDVHRVDSYIEDQGLRHNPVFPRLIQALIELARKDHQPDERSLLESIMNHVTARGAHPQMCFRLEESGQ